MSFEDVLKMPYNQISLYGAILVTPDIDKDNKNDDLKLSADDPANAEKIRSIIYGAQ